MRSDAFVARVSVWRTGLLVAAGAGFVALGGQMVAASPDPLSLPSVFGLASILFFGACTIVGLRQLLRRGPVMTIDAEGIRWVRWSGRTVPWSAIRTARVIQVQRQHIVALDLHDPAAWPVAGVLGRVAGANRALGWGDVALTTAGLDRSFAELCAAIDRHAPTLLAA